MTDEITRDHETKIHSLSRRVADFIKEQSRGLEVPTEMPDSTALTVAGCAYAMIVAERIRARPESVQRARSAASYTMLEMLDAELMRPLEV